jgi:hypothetical protein
MVGDSLSSNEGCSPVNRWSRHGRFMRGGGRRAAHVFRMTKQTSRPASETAPRAASDHKLAALQFEIRETKRRLIRYGVSAGILLIILLVGLPIAVDGAARDAAAELSQSYGVEVTEADAHRLTGGETVSIVIHGKQIEVELAGRSGSLRLVTVADVPRRD